MTFLGHILGNLIAKITGKNPWWMIEKTIVQQMNEPRPLPMGRTEFKDWSDRIMSGALVPADLNQSREVYEDSVRYALANLLLHLGPTESHKPDAFFIHSLRKFAVNQVADTIRKELFDKGKERSQANLKVVTDEGNDV